jgi:RimJ/RimL family protein N-acetyltransferase
MEEPTPITIRGPRLLLRPMTFAEIDEEWLEILHADPMTVAAVPDEATFKARLSRTGHLEDGWLDLTIDLDGECIGRIQTFVPPGRELPPGVFMMGIGLREHARNRGYGREALAMLTDWLFEHAGAVRFEAPTDPENLPMRRVFEHVGWRLVGPITEFDREWMLYAITREEWDVRNKA